MFPPVSAMRGAVSRAFTPRKYHPAGCAASVTQAPPDD
jgi:hypothetical protein